MKAYNVLVTRKEREHSGVRIRSKSFVLIVEEGEDVHKKVREHVAAFYPDCTLVGYAPRAEIEVVPVE